jgi:hypothetical protein
MKSIRIFLLVLIIIGLGLLATTHFWVPSVVNAIIGHEGVSQVVPVSTTTTPTSVSSKPHPTIKPKPSITSGIDITATIGPVCPVAHSPELPECADKPYEATLVLASTIIGRNGGVLIKTDAQGHYSQDLEPGTYTVRAQSTKTPPTLSRTVLHLSFDSGIR